MYVARSTLFLLGLSNSLGLCEVVARWDSQFITRVEAVTVVYSLEDSSHKIATSTLPSYSLASETPTGSGNFIRIMTDTAPLRTQKTNFGFASNLNDSFSDKTSILAPPTATTLGSAYGSSSSINSTALALTSTTLSLELLPPETWAASSASKTSNSTLNSNSTRTGGCAFETFMAKSLVNSSVGSEMQTYCKCDKKTVAINIATSASSTTSYCATGGPVPSGFTQVSSQDGSVLSPMQQSSGNWSTNKCSLALTGNTGYSNLQMWTEADAAGAWNYISNLPYDGTINWSSFVARELNFSSWQEYQCQDLSANNDCMYQQDCAVPITPGAWMVVNSIANLWSVRVSIF